MKRLKTRFGCLLTVLTVLMLATVSAKAEEDCYYDDFWVEVDPDGMAFGGGSGYNNGMWYLYPETGWWNEWFYNGPFDPDRMKWVKVQLWVIPMFPGNSWAEIAINWSSPEWPPGNPPPIPPLTPEEEQMYIKRFTIPAPIEIWEPMFIEYEYEIPNYNPEWVSIDIQGMGVMISPEPPGLIEHCCIDKPPEACCFPDGSCEDLTEEGCLERDGDPQGAGTNCNTTICPQPITEACCLPDETCIDTTTNDCIAQGGTSQGPETDCSMVDCDCGWNEGDPHKMHWPQLPKQGGWDVEFAMSFLADDWQCSSTGEVNDIHFWVSWAMNQQQPIDNITVGIFSDNPDPDGDGPLYSMPSGKVLWSRSFHRYLGEFTIRNMPEDLQSWFDPSSGEWGPDDHTLWQQIDICNIPDPFVQEQGTIYWLSVSFGELPFVGWKVSGSRQFNDDGVWWDEAGEKWIELRDPTTDKSLDLAFVITPKRPVTPDVEYGDAPEESMAYPSLGVIGKFPTCITRTVARFIQHGSRLARFEVTPPGWVAELDGNAGLCPLQPGCFPPYDQDECFMDGDAGLMYPEPFTINALLSVVPCPQSLGTPLGTICHTAQWGVNADIRVVNQLAADAYVNVLIDWNQDGQWTGSSTCPGGGTADEHVLKNLPVPAGWAGLLSALGAGQFLIGPNPGYVWTRFTITEKPVPLPGWTGDGIFNHGETEDYLFLIEDEGPVDQPDFGDAPEGGVAYPVECVQGAFPTCMTIGPALWIQHNIIGNAYFGPTVDSELDGDAGLCPPPACFPTYDDDECFQDGDAGLIMPPSYTIQGPAGSETVVPCVSTQTGSLGKVCQTAIWGQNIDINVVNNLPLAYVNVLADWNRNGAWGGIASCATAATPEHILKNFIVPGGYIGPLSGVPGGPPPNFLIGPYPGYVWFRFTISDQPLPEDDWHGEEYVQEGETEDYLLHVKPKDKTIECDWNLGDGHKMHWPQLPDLNPTGIDVDMATADRMADDFKCTDGGPIKDIHFWASFAGDCLPAAGVDGLTFQLSIYSNSPATGLEDWSEPNELLWTRTFVPCTYTVRQVARAKVQWWYDPATGTHNPADHFQTYQYNFCIDDDPFIQEEGAIYWLEVKKIWPDEDANYNFGWKTTKAALRWNDDAVWFDENPPLAPRGWVPLTYPVPLDPDDPCHPYAGQTLDLAFVITGEEAPPPEYDWGDAPDPPYPTLALSNGANHIIAGPWLDASGQPDAEPDGQPDDEALGDDLDTNDDEDGVFIPPLVRGQTTFMTVKVGGGGIGRNIGGGVVQGWIDFFTTDGWQAAEQVYNGFLGPGLHTIPVRVPANADLGQSFARFRISTNGGLSPVGSASDGEVEDHEVSIIDPPPNTKWLQLPDLTPNGIDIRADDLRILADDFRCTSYGRITDVHLWGSWKDDIEGEIKKIHLSIHPDDPAGPGGSDPQNPFSQPDIQPLWEKDFGPDQFTASLYARLDAGEYWWDPVNDELIPDGDSEVWQIDIDIDPDEAFLQDGSAVYPVIYWLDVRFETENGQFGWKTRQWPYHFLDDAVWDHGSELPRMWKELRYPEGHPYHGLEMDSIDMAFAITGKEELPLPKPPVEHLKWSQPPIERYPTSRTPIYCGWDEPSFSVPVGGTRNFTDVLFDNVDPNNHIYGWPGGVGASYMTTASIQVNKNCIQNGTLMVKVHRHTDTLDNLPTAPHCTNQPIDVSTVPPTVPLGCYDFDDAHTVHIFVPTTNATGTVAASGAVTITDTGGTLIADNPAISVQGNQSFNWPGWGGWCVRGSSTGVKFTFTGIDPATIPGTYALVNFNLGVTNHMNGDFGLDGLVDITIDPLIPPQQTADDFRCLGDMPITSLHWWGSYLDWYSQAPPMPQPIAWLFNFWSNVPAPIDPQADPNYSHPERLLWQIQVDANRVHTEWVGTDQFPDMWPEACFQYYVDLEPNEYFWQEDYNDLTEDNIFWLSIVAVYPNDIDVVDVNNPWGWKTRPWHWEDDAVTFELDRDILKLNMVLDPNIIAPVEDALVCGELQSYDMAFELDTDPNYIKWEQPFTGIRHWPHYEDELSMGIEPMTKYIQRPDLSETGVDVDATGTLTPPAAWPPQILADDFPCSQTGEITDVHIWGSWFYDEPPVGDPNNVVFTLSFHSNNPEGPDGWSVPDELLWTCKFEPGQFTVERVPVIIPEAFYCPCIADGYFPNNHLRVWKYSFYLPDAGCEPFIQQEDKIYWLDVQAEPGLPTLVPDARFGWKTSLEHWNDDAVWDSGSELPRMWKELRYPPEHPFYLESIDLAFAITTEAEPDIIRLVADDWKCERRTPVTAAVWWGSYIGYEYQACQCLQMAPPVKPDYFLLSIWTNVPATDEVPYSHPDEKIWQYKAYDYDEVLVGYDKHPQGERNEPVFRYSVQIPEPNWFCQEDVNEIYWFSVVAVYKGPSEPPYPWGWTNHKCAAWEPPGLIEVGHWKFDETSGTMASDSSANGNHGTLIGDPTWQPCCNPVCGALDFDGDGDYVKTADTTTGLDFAPNSFSVSAWINARETTNGWRTILEYDRESISKNWFGIWLSSTGKFHFRVGKDTQNSNQTLNPNQWYLLTATFDSTDKTMRLYIDGQLDASGIQSTGFSSPNAAKLTIGVRGWEDDEFFDGLIDDVRIYDRVLSAAEIQALADMAKNDDAVEGGYVWSQSEQFWEWQPLYDQIGMSEDMSFILYTTCFPCCHDDYSEWLSVGKPRCWCYPRQCYGDADGLKEGSAKKGYYYVHFDDLNVLLAGWDTKEQPHGPGIDTVTGPNGELGICADFAHDKQGSAKKGYYRVHFSDLNLLIANWNTKEPPDGPGVDPDCLDCP